MRKKIIFLAVCAVLLLIFMSSSYGELDPKYIRVLGDPWSEADICSAQDSTIVFYDKAPTGNNRIDVLIIRIMETNFIFTVSRNSFSSPKNSIHKPDVLKEK